jgi:hypothetical protein
MLELQNYSDLIANPPTNEMTKLDQYNSNTPTSCRGLNSGNFDSVVIIKWQANLENENGKLLLVLRAPKPRMT